MADRVAPANVVRLRDGPVTPYGTSSESVVTGVTDLQELRIRGAGLVSIVSDYLGQYMSMTEEQRIVCAVWVVHTHCFDASYFTPYLNILSPQRQSGKTTLFDILKMFSHNPMDTAHITAAGLRRAFEGKTRTLFWDEVDNVFKRKDEDTAEIKSVLNAGFKRGAKVHINVRKGNDWKLQEFNVYSPKVICGIGELPDVLASRSIPIRLERKPKTEEKRRFEEGRETGTAEFVQKAMSEWSKDAVAHLKAMDPDAPAELDGRQADVWRPLFSIGDLIGMGERIRDIAVTLHAKGTVLSREAMLLRDIRDIFEASKTEQFFSSDLVGRLSEIETSPWSTYNHGKGFQPYDLASVLEGFGVSPTPIRIGETQRRGYRKQYFLELWERYL